MRIQVAVFTVVATAAVALTQMTVVSGQAPAAEKTTWDNVYSAAQATKGAKIYEDKCIRCHGTDGVGADAPALVGSDFAADWDGLSVYQLFDRTRSSMPQDDPGTMSREDTAAVVAWMLQKNGFPAAADPDLPSDSDALNAIKYKATKP